MKKFLIVSSILLVLAGCSSIPKKIEPKITQTINEQYLQTLPSPFSELTAEEMKTDWGKEYYIGLQFARSLDLYRAITAFKRAEFLVPSPSKRKTEIEYEILLSYYLGGRYADAERTFSRSSLGNISSDFPPFHDLLIILYETFLELKDTKRSAQVLEMAKQHFPQTYQNLVLSTALKSGELKELEEDRQSLKNLLRTYNSKKKSPKLAAALNAILPGSGYLYVGQKQTAFTAFAINGLFIWASVYFFAHGNIAAGVIALGFEAGWYFGGIYGASREANFYNERLYEQLALPILNSEKLFPIFLLKNGF